MRVAYEVCHPEVGDAPLSETQEFAWSSDAQVLLGYLESVVGFNQSLEPLTR